ncbi:MAG: AbrB/MazE/SpoVT family DNA-binding domain-containing protein [Candidatus Scalindua sp.]|nr:AbrB/MazE/SpoVT family DNA-binding domain-containing protein [Candidatus Scalindua sp.]MCR4344245.1 AbrB/MazE/SpoVT family DNA-binding domain-containing protein [Candidatus Scalindua sp.]
MSKVTSKYQITIPVSVRKTLGIIPGSDIDIVSKGDDFVLKLNPIEDLKRAWRGKHKGKKSSNQYMTIIRGEV